MTAIIGEFSVQFIKFIVLAGAALAAVFCGKRLRDRKNLNNE